MKKIHLLVLLLPLICIAQPQYSKQISYADSLYRKKMYRESGSSYDEAFRMKNGTSSHYYNAACSWALADDPKKAVKYLKKAAENEYCNVEWVQKDIDLEAVRKLSVWPEILSMIQKNLDQLKTNGLTNEQKQKVLESAANAIQDYYYSEEKGKIIAATLLAEVKKGRFDTAGSTKNFFRGITQYLRTATNDLHFYLGLDHEFWTPASGTSSGKLPLTDKEKNYGFTEVKILPGNIGYVKWDYCIANDAAFAKAAAVMNYLADAKAIVVDLRENGGGNGRMGTFLGAYFLGPDKPVTDGSCRDKSKNKVERTANYIPGNSMSGVPLFILISGNTGSAAEYFAHYMKEEKRAVIIGQNSAGAAHPAIIAELPYKVLIQVPECTLWAYKTGKDFEGIGVIPDVELPANQLGKAIDVVQRKLLHGHL